MTTDQTRISSEAVESGQSTEIGKQSRVDPQDEKAYEWPEGEPIRIDPRYYQEWKDRYQKSKKFNDSEEKK